MCIQHLENFGAYLHKSWFLSVSAPSSLSRDKRGWSNPWPSCCGWQPCPRNKGTRCSIAQKKKKKKSSSPHCLIHIFIGDASAPPWNLSIRGRAELIQATFEVRFCCRFLEKMNEQRETKISSLRGLSPSRDEHGVVWYYKITIQLSSQALTSAFSFISFPWLHILSLQRAGST